MKNKKTLIIVGAIILVIVIFLILNKKKQTTTQTTNELPDMPNSRDTSSGNGEEIFNIVKNIDKLKAMAAWAEYIDAGELTWEWFFWYIDNSEDKTLALADARKNGKTLNNINICTAQQTQKIKDLEPSSADFKEAVKIAKLA